MSGCLRFLPIWGASKCSADMFVVCWFCLPMQRIVQVRLGWFGVSRLWFDCCALDDTEAQLLSVSIQYEAKKAAGEVRNKQAKRNGRARARA